LTKDVELKNTNSGIAVTSFTIAVNRPPTKNNDNPDADFPRITAFGKTAEFAANYLAKGRLILVEGRLQTGKYEKSDGTTQYTTDVIADRIVFMEKKSEQAAYTQEDVTYSDSAEPMPQPEAFADNNTTDELPF
jgi:single-strand DNA-binding protein